MEGEGGKRERGAREKKMRQLTQVVILGAFSKICTDSFPCSSHIRKGVEHPFNFNLLWRFLTPVEISDQFARFDWLLFMSQSL